MQFALPAIACLPALLGAGCGGTPLEPGGAAGSGGAPSATGVVPDGGAGSGDAALECRGVYSCPDARVGEVTVASGLAPLHSVSAAAPCRADFVNGEAEVVVDGTIPPGSTWTCTVHGTLTDGTDVVASVSFQSLGGCCAPLSTAIGGPVSFQPTGETCAAGCPNEGTCGTIEASDYDQSCSTDADCVAEPEGDFCAPNRCTNCPTAAISAKAEAQYEQDLASKIGTPEICPCPSPRAPTCVHGACTL